MLSLFRTLTGLKEQEKKWCFWGQLKTSLETTVDGHTNLENLTFHLCHSYGCGCKDGNVE